MEGYNIAFLIDGNTVAGRVQDDLTIAAKVKESLTKDDAGATQVSVTGHDITFRASGLVVAADDSDHDRIGRNTLMETLLDLDENDEIPFYYVDQSDVAAASRLTIMSGNCVITGYSESSNASDEATWTADFRVTGDVTMITPADPSPNI